MFPKFSLFFFLQFLPFSSFIREKWIIHQHDFVCGNSAETLYDLRASCNFSNEVDFVVPSAEEDSERVSSGFWCAYTSYFTSCGLHFPFQSFWYNTFLKPGFVSPNIALISFVKLSAWLSWRLTPDVPFKWGISFVWVMIKNSRPPGTISFTTQSNRWIISGLPLEDSSWWTSYFFFWVDVVSMGSILTQLLSSWTKSTGKETRPYSYDVFAPYFF